MAYDELLADRIRGVLGDEMGVSEKKMFGGIAFMINGNMAVGVSGNELMLRVGLEAMDELLDIDGVRPFDKTGRPMKGWVLVEASETAEDAQLSSWIDIGVSVAASLPPK